MAKQQIHPKSLFSAQNPNWLMTTEEMKEILGLGRNKKLPAKPRYFGEVAELGGRIAVLRGLIGEAQRIGSGFYRNQFQRRMRHRLYITCCYCGCQIPAGRLHQHEPYCKQRDNG